MPDAAVAAATALAFSASFCGSVKMSRERERRPNDDKIYVDVDGS